VHAHSPGYAIAHFRSCATHTEGWNLRATIANVGSLLCQHDRVLECASRGSGLITTRILLLEQAGEKFINTFLLLREYIVQTLIELLPVFLDVALYCCLVQALVQRGVLSVYVDFSIVESKPLRRLLVKDDIQWHLLCVL